MSLRGALELFSRGVPRRVGIGRGPATDQTAQNARKPHQKQYAVAVGGSVPGATAVTRCVLSTRGRIKAVTPASRGDQIVQRVDLRIRSHAAQAHDVRPPIDAVRARGVAQGPGRISLLGQRRKQAIAHRIGNIELFDAARQRDDLSPDAAGKLLQAARVERLLLARAARRRALAAFSLRRALGPMK